MGLAYVAVKALFDELGVETVVPPAINKRTLEIGTKLSPEMACLPLKINMGNYLESIRRGADTIVLTGSCGPCRFGYYGIVQKEILRDLGYDVDVVILDPPNGDWKAFFERIQKVSGNCSLSKIYKAFKRAYMVVQKCDEMEKTALKKRPREKLKGETDQVLMGFERQAARCHGAMEILRLIEETRKELLEIEEIPDFEPLKIGIIGEIYTIIEPFVNLYVEKKLGNMGVESDKSLSVGEWVKTHLSMDLKHKHERKRIMNKAKPYLGLCIGGHAWETVAYAVHFAECAFDGLIQILPFGCMPEIVAESILPRIAEDKNIPLMTLTVDEMTGEAGYITRLEAFVDMIHEKKGRRDG